MTTVLLLSYLWTGFGLSPPSVAQSGLAVSASCDAALARCNKELSKRVADEFKGWCFANGPAPAFTVRRFGIEFTVVCFEPPEQVRQS